MAKMKVRLTLTEPMLGTSPANEDIYREFIGSKAPDAATVEDEVAAFGVEAVADKGTTVFPKTEDGMPFLWDYQIKGFFKDACSMLARLSSKETVTDPASGKSKTVKKCSNESGKLTAYKKIIDGLIFPQPRKIPIVLSGPIGLCQRPLRAQTAQGERVSLACSEEVPAGSTLTFEIVCLDEGHIPAVKEWLDYGTLRGLGQWRNSGAGRFTWEELKSDA